MTDLPLDEQTVRFIEERVARIKSLESELQGAMQLILAQQELTGNWQLDTAGRRLVKSDPGATA